MEPDSNAFSLCYSPRSTTQRFPPEGILSPCADIAYTLRTPNRRAKVKVFADHNRFRPVAGCASLRRLWQLRVHTVYGPFNDNYRAL